MYYNRPKRKFEYFLPFLILVAVGVILVLMVQLWFSMRGPGEGKVEGDVYLYSVSGRSKVLSWGEETWSNGYHGMKLLEGDSVRVLSAGRVGLSFFDDLLLRLGEGSEITLDTLDEKHNMKEISLRQGALWINTKRSEGLIINTANLRILPRGTVFEVEVSEAEIVRVISGRLDVEIVSRLEEETNVLEKIVVGVGQQIEISAEDIGKLAYLTDTDFLEALSLSFQETDWYKWNMSEDENPTDFTKKEEEEEPVEIEEPEEPEEVEEVEEVDITPPEVKITFPDDGYVLEEPQITIEGTTSSDTVKVKVTAYTADGEVDEYTLRGYKAGEIKWAYHADFKYKNLAIGRNRYIIEAFDAAANKSEKVSVIIEVPESLKEKLQLEAPEIVSFNGESINVTDQNEVLIKGGVSEHASQVFVDGVLLSSYVPGSSEFDFSVSEEAGNLECGKNYYDVYAENEFGGQSKVVRVEVVRLCLGGSSEA